MNDVTRLELPLVGPVDWDNTFSSNDLDRPRYWDRRGNPITFREWATLTSYTDKEGKLYKIVKQEYVEDYWVSTVWLGLNHGWGDAPIIFETMVFKDGESDLDMERYSTEEEAMEGHKRIRDKVALLNDACS